MRIVLEKIGQDQPGFDKVLPQYECSFCGRLSRAQNIRISKDGDRSAVWKCCGMNLVVSLDSANIPLLSAPWGINSNGHMARIY